MGRLRPPLGKAGSHFGRVGEHHNKQSRERERAGRNQGVHAMESRCTASACSKVVGRNNLRIEGGHVPCTPASLRCDEYQRKQHDRASQGEQRNMKVCVPATQALGIKSPVSAHFGSAPMFVIVDTETGACETIPNQNMHHAHGGCQPLRALAGHDIDGVVVGGIGMGAMMKLRAAGIRVYLADQPTVEEAVAACKAGTLQAADPKNACSHHGHGHGDHDPPGS